MDIQVLAKWRSVAESAASAGPREWLQGARDVLQLNLPRALVDAYARCLQKVARQRLRAVLAPLATNTYVPAHGARAFGLRLHTAAQIAVAACNALREIGCACRADELLPSVGQVDVSAALESAARRTGSRALRTYSKCRENEWKSTKANIEEEIKRSTPGDDDEEEEEEEEEDQDDEDDDVGTSSEEEDGTADLLGTDTDIDVDMPLEDDVFRQRWDSCLAGEEFGLFCESMALLGLETLAVDTVTTVVMRAVKRVVDRECRGKFSRTRLPVLQAWRDTIANAWVDTVLRAYADDARENTKKRIDFCMYNALANLRISELFNIIVDYPDSHGAVIDLVNCMERTRSKAKLVSSLAEAFRSRLLHPAASTDDIITQYVLATKVLAHMDSGNGRMTREILQPVREYLRIRNDTVRRIVAAIIDPSRSEWFTDNTALPTLVSIYGSADVFVNAYRNLLGEKVLRTGEFDIDEEARNLEIMKSQFGESVLAACEVMVKDMKDSRRLRSHLKTWSKRQSLAGDTYDEAVAKLETLVFSREYWPPFETEPIKLPNKMQELATVVNRHFSDLKHPRKLEWHHSLGQIDLDVTIKGETVSFQVTPMHAAVLCAVEESSDGISLEDLAKKLEAKEEDLHRRVQFWTSRGVLTQDDTGVLRPGAVSTAIADLQNDDEEQGPSAEDLQQAQEMKVYEHYIIGMLTNFDGLPLDRIHNMLKMFVVDVSYDRTERQLAAFLDSLVAQDTLEKRDGLYAIRK